MPLQPYLTQVHVDRPLTNISVAYIQDESAFVSTQHAVIPSDKKSNLYFIYDQATWMADQAKPRGPNEESAGSGYKVSTTQFNCQVYALHKDIDEQVLMNTDDPLDGKRDAIKFITRKLLIRQELQFMSDLMTTSIWTGSSTGGDITPAPTWDDPTSTPIEDVQVQQAAILAGTGFLPNVFYLAFQTYQKLIRHPDVIDLIKYGASQGNPAIANEDALAKIFGVEEVIVSKGVYTTSAENVTTATFGLMASKNAMLVYVPSSPGLYTPSAFYSFMWTGVSHGLGKTIGAYEIPMPWYGLTTVRVEAQIAFTNKVVGATLGAYFTGAVA